MKLIEMGSKLHQPKTEQDESVIGNSLKGKEPNVSGFSLFLILSINVAVMH
jgi:hypothetical protein